MNKISLKYLLNTFIAFTTLLFSHAAVSQTDTTIARTFGGPFYEEGNQIIACAEGGYAMIGTTGSDQPNNTNFYLVRIDQNFNCLWSANYGGLGIEKGFSIVENDEGDFLLCGYTNSYGEGGYDILVYKVNSEGDLIWQKTFGGSDWDFSKKMIKHPEDGYLICGNTYSIGNGGSDAYLLHINEDGVLLNEWTFGDEGDEEFNDLIVYNSTIYLCGAIKQNPNWSASVWSVDLQSGEVNWQHLDGATGKDYKAYGITTDGGRLYVCGEQDTQTFASGYYEYLTFDGELTYYLIPVEYSNSYFYKQIAVMNDNVYVIGTTRAFGMGGADGFLYRFHLDNYYTGGLFYGGTADDSFTSFLLEEGKIVFSGARQSSETQQWQALAILYTKSNLESENNMNPVDQTCFTVDVDDANISKPISIEQYSIYDITGKLILNNERNSIENIFLKVNSGFYLIVSHDKTIIKKVIIP